MTTHPTPPDQTAAAQEREALHVLAGKLSAENFANQHPEYALQWLAAHASECGAIYRALSTQQPEPCVDVENKGLAAQKEGDRD